ncbi:hypothetical protein [Pelagerythrobacter sp.]|uniref:hypothetical protein n=1 Tax=Pelagerythrobacter sp. TaxID=2800702 RepID=UPI0035B05BE0
MKRLALPVIAGGLSGFAATLLFLNLTDAGGGAGLEPSREIAGLVGILYAIVALAIAVGIASPSFGARFLNVEDADELREQRRSLGYSMVGMALLGGALFLLAFVEPGGPIGGTVGAAGAIGLVIAAVVLTRLQARHVDEFQRALSREASASALYLLFVFGGGWALLAHCGLAAAPAPLDWLTMFAAALVVGCVWQAARRGLLTRGPR